jgi:protoheme IX farnesyltransferase
LDGFYEDYERQVSLCCLLVKDKGTALQVIYTVWLLIASLLPTLGYRKLFISPIAGF